MANNRVHVLVAVLGVLWSGVAAAQEAPAPAPAPTAPPAAPAEQLRPLAIPGAATLGDLDSIQGQILLAEAKAKLADARVNLAKAEGNDVDGGGPPVVAGVFGPADHPYARFLLSDGSQLIGREGDVLSGGYRVVRIGVDKVVIKDKKGREVVARFSGSAPAAQTPASPQQQAASPRPTAPGFPPER
jgi:type IV pilus biogenesis protein PilP